DGLLTSAGAMTLTRDPVNGFITATVLGSVTDVATFNSFGERTDYEAKYGTTSLLNFHSTRDKISRVVEEAVTVGGVASTYAYTYDSAGRLWQVIKDGSVVVTYLYDGNGNRSSRTTPDITEAAATDDQDRLLTYGRFSFTYTANGELLTKTDTTTGEVTTYG